jgi:hypothetical protein
MALKGRVKVSCQEPLTLRHSTLGSVTCMTLRPSEKYHRRLACVAIPANGHDIFLPLKLRGPGDARFTEVKVNLIPPCSL